ncbi:HCL490Wp [Eremothecium sinecaudum]|uniref:DNA primase large subunit n=1 Tax=Eremothecium sinecaudum TaxID=45286 RepID=A0A109UY28_9SACH|nr:HCL490Wp [Eremothecium sinecaudum]AMD19661.1 HCL490Wp [Eremothecium sinecaudum]
MFRQTKRRITQRRNNVPGDENALSGYIHSGISVSELQAHYDLLYPAKLSFYQYPPEGEITLDQFETWAIDRLKVLLEIESLAQRNRSTKEMEQVIKPLLTKYLPLSDDLELRKKDYYSHFILRLCFCRTKELREKFAHAETLLFNLRFQMLTQADQAKFIRSLDLPLLRFIDEAEKQEIAAQLYDAVVPQLQFQFGISDEQQRRQFFKQEKFIKLPFESVLDLVGSRQVFVKGGWAYLPQFQQLKHISNEYSDRLAAELLRTYQHLPKLNEDDRLLPILAHLSSGYMIGEHKRDYSSNANVEDGSITATTVYSPEVRSCFPLCASNLLQGLSDNHHLRFNGRQQLSFFLKGIGMSVDEAMKFWTDAFTSGGSMTLERFNKEYRYNFRHNYSLEGNRINYKPWDCRTILSKPRPAKGEYHGCPYRDWNPDKLATHLTNMKLTHLEINSVLDSCQHNEYTVACTKVYEFTNPTNNTLEVPITDQTHITHPNLFFDRARCHRDPPS